MPTFPKKCVGLWISCANLNQAGRVFEEVTCTPFVDSERFMYIAIRCGKCTTSKSMSFRGQEYPKLSLEQLKPTRKGSEDDSNAHYCHDQIAR